MASFPSTVPGDHAIILDAVAFAIKAHGNQVRKYTNDSYILHPIAVARGVATRTMDPHVIAAAVLHDVIEDTETRYHDLLQRFGERIAGLVHELTDQYTYPRYPELGRAARKRYEAQRMGTTSAEAQLIKAYDILDNTSSIIEHDRAFAKVYLNEKIDLIHQMTKLDPHERLILDGSIRSMVKSLTGAKEAV
jgi:guanosine-3',5'-bis(diphosphate) 3'-pyrophosphohydrolase